jgi:MSHA biogenesis protein MshP
MRILAFTQQRGLGAVAVIVVLVLLAAVAAAVVRFGMQGQTMVQQDVQALRAAAAARTGIEWGLFQALKGSWTTCSGASQTLDLSADGGMRVTVSCSSTVYNEGKDSLGADQTLRMFTIDAVACNSATSCPDATAAVRSGYAEARRQVQAALAATHPGLQLELLRRPDLRDGDVTLMETYAGPLTDAVLEAITQATSALPQPRHSEHFDTLDGPE